ncbi:MFS transporter [Streptomyces meridianus]|uniref:MFS transporter n=1 Tax=Streptomyces meridianus TaxID=2938945 RepID=A0ABT0XCP5_9ACTN|nr:MFS transporter [Streptomyces meridianus]MCM2580160.1 MFS transporter [Streptomyces meridianus]
MAMTAPADLREGPAADTSAPPMSHRQILEALSGLMLGMFVAILSSTIVSTALPEIIHDLDGGQSAYTWVVTASLLAMTATTPLWGKLADLTSKKTLVQSALILYVLASAGAGLAQNTGVLIAFRAVQGIGVGGLSALAQVIMAAMISPRERGRYSGYLGATFAVATVGGPLLGGVITDTDWLGWRWCFYVGVPFAVVALITLQKTLKLPVTRRKVKVDWTGAVLVSAAVSLLLVWVTLAGDRYAWASWQSCAMVGGSAVLALLFLLVESRASEPIIPLRLFRNRTITLTSFASLFVGIAMFGATVFLSQYFQLARGESPTMAGVMTIPLIGGLFVSSTVSGLAITRTGRWKAWLVIGGVLVTAGLGLLGTMRHDTEYWHLAVFMGLLGLGIGMMMQNLVLATQNQVSPQDLGSASSVVTFFRSLGGAVGVSALGAVLGHRVKDYVADGMAALGIRPGDASGGSVIPDPDRLPAPVRTVVEDAYGHGIADIYLYAAPVALLALLFVLFVKEVPLRTHRPGEPDGNAAPLPAADATGTVPAAATTVPASEGPETIGCADASPTGTGLHGFVREAEGTAVPRAAVTLISLGGRQLGRSIARPDGAYALDVPEPGSYVLIAAADGHQPQASTVVVGDERLSHDVLLSGTSGLEVTVRDAAGGEPVAGALVVVTDERGEVLATGHTDEGGEAEFGELVPGTFTVAVDATGFRPAAHPVEVGGRRPTRTGIELEPGALVQGIVRAGSGRSPLPDARVTLVDSAGNVVATATTGEDGSYAFPGLDTGDYTVVASGYPPAATPLAVQGRGVDGHDIELAHPGE